MITVMCVYDNSGVWWVYDKSRVCGCIITAVHPLYQTVTIIETVISAIKCVHPFYVLMNIHGFKIFKT